MTTDELLSQMSTVLFFDGVWHARARGSAVFAKGATPHAAMWAALYGL